MAAKRKSGAAHTLRNQFRDGFVDAFTRIPDFRQGLLGELTPTEISSLLKTIQCSLTHHEKMNYLHPLRELVDFQPMFDQLKHDGYQLAIVGSDLKYLSERIQDPFHVDRGTNLVVWLAIFCSPEKDDIIKLNDTCAEHNQEMVSKFLDPLAMENNRAWYASSWYRTRTSPRAGVTIVFYVSPVFHRSGENYTFVSMEDSGVDSEEGPASKTIVREDKQGYVSAYFHPRLVELERSESDLPWPSITCTTYYLKIDGTQGTTTKITGEEMSTPIMSAPNHIKLIEDDPGNDYWPRICVSMPFPDQPFEPKRNTVRILCHVDDFIDP